MPIQLNILFYSLTNILSPLPHSSVVAIMKVALFTTLFAVSQAFQAPVAPAPRTALRESMDVGVTQPLGFFDPLGYISDQATFER